MVRFLQHVTDTGYLIIGNLPKNSSFLPNTWKLMEWYVYCLLNKLHYENQAASMLLSDAF